jgi:uncharacterized protein YaiI (UPF0178 family)
MRFLGFDFRSVALPATLNYTPKGWSDSLTIQVARSATPARTRLVRSDGPAVKQLTPMALESNLRNLPTLPCSQVISALVTAAAQSGAGVIKTTSAAQLPDILSQRAQILESSNMSNVICAGFMIATFQYDFAPAPTTPPVTAADFDKLKQCAAQDVVVGTAFNLAKKKLGNGIKETVLHNAANNLDQVHTEQLLCGQIDAFLELLKNQGNQAVVINVYDRYKFKADGFDMSKITVRLKIVFEHRQNNVRTDCDACASVIKQTIEKWSPRCEAFSVAVAKNS